MIAGSVPMFIGAAANPFARPYELRALRLAKKVEAGADYVQTQCVYDVKMFAEWMKAVRDLGLHTKCRVLAGVTPLKSAGMTRYMAEKVPGIIIPPEIVKRMADAPKGKGAETGLAICQEIISAHGGRIWAEPDRSTGALFCIEIPDQNHGVDGSSARAARDSTVEEAVGQAVDPRQAA